MQKKTTSLLSAVTAGAVFFTGVALSASHHTAHRPIRSVQSAHAVLAAYTMPTINLDDCPTLSSEYHGGCVNQLQTELNTIDGANLPVDGTFGPGTMVAVEAFQKENGISPVDGIVGPQTKAALDNPVSNSVATPQPGSAAPASPNCSQDATQGPPSASIPPGQQSYFQCQPPGEPGKNINGTDCILGLTALGLGAAAGPAGDLADLWALGGLGVGDVAAVRAC
jgi:Putative peptidoglycan binding domain